MSKITVLIVDDSLTMRAIIKSVLAADREINVIGEAADAYEAREKVKSLNPDVLLLDVEMPKMSGIEFLEKVMSLRPMPVVMLSGSTKRGAKDTIEALRLGAFECLEKPSSSNYISGLSNLGAVLKAAVRHGTRSPNLHAAEADPSTRDVSYTPDNSIIGIGSSTGGVEALMKILSKFPKNCPPVVITQHMPELFLESFADRLNRSVKPTVQLAADGDVLQSGHVYLGPGGDNHLEIHGRRRFHCQLKSSDPVSGHRPSVDVMFSSMARAAKGRGIGVILTGLGRDGAQGLLTMRQAGAKTIGQDEQSCIVYGMPKVAAEIGALENQIPLHLIGNRLLDMSCKTQSKTIVSQ
jgi:two-component system chemotaxis response regulator CheB